MNQDAIFDSERKYRYLLTREWDTNLPKLLYIMLNPSVANEVSEDRTSKQCLYFANKFQYGSLEIVNLYSLISTDPKGLKKSLIDPVGSETDKHIREAALRADRVIVAWGEKHFFNKRDKQVIELLRKEEVELFCLKMAKTGHPRHPSRLGHDIEELIRFG
ncbi:DUF1643 domain-containing protein [Paenibacillus azoreducens]|uniref:DUF1643 domain-containing protein n=1 Tax=Paenibacillus azoreducens TaxID=116718 RepID=A0A919YD58_9BACL|nr:DUF1643 domain-containing protein [Paenibacillus azoreducens]GIO49446.1 hypothetical protein J34TS1_42110 [Paenibacillus azoreducens]